MARAEVVRAQPVQPPVEKVVLEMTPNEAVMVYRALGRVPFDVAKKCNRDMFTYDANISEGDARKAHNDLWYAVSDLLRHHGIVQKGSNL